MDDSILAKAKEFIRAHLKEDFSLSALAREVGYSPFHLAREFKQGAGMTIMEYTRQARVQAAATELADGSGVCDTAIAYCFDTHAGFTRAFSAEFGCTPKEYRAFSEKKKHYKGVTIMSDSIIKIRHVCTDDVQDLWENCYSAMTPRQITELKIQPSIEAERMGLGFMLVAELDGTVVKPLALSKRAHHIPLGFIGDNIYQKDIVLQKLLEEMRRQAKGFGISALMAIEDVGSESSRAFQAFGFRVVLTAGDLDYLMIGIG
jgi:AraC-like DNA-binding protein